MLNKSDGFMVSSTPWNVNSSGGCLFLLVDSFLWIQSWLEMVGISTWAQHPQSFPAYRTQTLAVFLLARPCRGPLPELLDHSALSFCPWGHYQGSVTVCDHNLCHKSALAKPPQWVCLWHQQTEWYHGSFFPSSPRARWFSLLQIGLMMGWWLVGERSVGALSHFLVPCFVLNGKSELLNQRLKSPFIKARC